MSAFDRALILTGPTACGKSALALDLCARIGGEVVALDSMTVYRGMDLGTAKPSPADRARVPHHLLDVLDPWESLTVAWWLERAETACADIVGRGKRPIFVGGTPFYLKALLHGLFPGPPADPALRAALEADALTGKPISSWQTTWDTASFAESDDRRADAAPLAIPAARLELPREVLYDRINRRVTAMLDAGFLAEVRRLRDLPHPLSREARQALGYRELLDWLDRGGDWGETVTLIRTHTRQFAKRQMTWFRSLPACVPVPADAPDAAERVLAAWGVAIMSP